ncbi:MAG: UDP-N-acetylglucosamine--N-acetylmuramyl-(pentapeptide) pyrophosphoryl-undecaprenol N-acetylglucosamine transferase [Candidatus Omnitrophica bacterium]|nr:UDP-N-acetylglucosamine--N-acetylmuramyl-(pentapeptide) pyrophosphoryl-undecaprenol N-acetylglucosamine transferase [Candidatus Omnitrophota bacterium]
MNNDNLSKTIIIAGGATGGHFFPALTLAHELIHQHGITHIIMVVNEKAKLLQNHIPLDFFTPLEKKKNGESKFDGTVIEKGEKISSINNNSLTGLRYEYLPTLKRSRNIFMCMYTLIKAFIMSWRLISRVHPDVVVGFGSSVSVPLIITGWLQSVPTIIHEQNVIWGLANKLLYFFTKKVAISFPPGENQRRKEKIVYTGNLIRHDILDYIKNVRLSAEEKVNKKYTVLIVGGSQGACFINDVVIGMLAMLNEEERNMVRIQHILGERGHDTVYKEQYDKLDIEYYLYSFYFDITKLYKETDIVISRAGAGTLFEIMAFGIPSILIPYPYAGAHQYENASYVYTRGAALIFEQSDISPIQLKDALFSLIRNGEQWSVMRSRSKECAHLNGHELLAREVIKLL